MKKPVQQQIGRERGRRAGMAVDPAALAKDMANAFESLRRLFPTAADLDVAAEIRRCDAERLACQPDLARFPELRGHVDLLVAERQAFRKASGLDETAAAFRYSWWYFMTRRMNARHLARYDQLTPPDLILARHQCTNVFFPEGADGVTIADNRDDNLRLAYVKKIPAFRPGGPRRCRHVHWLQGGVSSAVILDDEPVCSFPANPIEYNLLPEDCLDDVDAIVAFMGRYGDFWGPGNQIWVDRQFRAVAVEKTNCRMAVRRPTSAGAIAITACAYLDDGLHAHQVERTTRAAALKGDTPDTSPDLQYHLGSRRRYRRLVSLADREAAQPGGATLWGALDIVADHAVPFPDRVCLAGERTFPDREPVANWSITQHAAVITGPKRRCLFRSIQDLYHPRPVYEFRPKLVLGPAVRMRPEWQADLDAGRCELAPPLPQG